MSTQGSAAKGLRRGLSGTQEETVQQSARTRKTATVVTTQLTSIYNALKGKDDLAT